MTRTLIKTGLLISGAALLIAAGPKADLNQDGEVTKAEFTQAAEARFLETDTNNDGFLSEDERKAYKDAKRQARKDKRFAKRDANGDGLLSPEELSSASDARKAKKSERRKEMMAKYDTNLDGELSDAERTVMKAELGDKFKERKAKRKGKRAERPKMDINEDGFVSQEEYMSVSEQLFTHMDANADGVLTKGEGRKRKGKRRGKRGE